MYSQGLDFIHNQIRQSCQQGLAALFKKLFSGFMLIFAVPVLVLIRILRPIVTVRFGLMHSDRIGHFALDTELYLCKRDVSMQNHRNIDIFYYGSAQTANLQLKKMWDRVLFTFSFAKWIDKVNRILPGAQNHIIPMEETRDIHGFLKDSAAPHISFTAKEDLFGQEGLRQMAIPAGKPLVCFHARDSVYLQTKLPARNWSYHGYRDSNIYNYLPAVEELIRRGYFAIRMGAAIKEGLRVSDARIIDYALNSRTDFMDVYLSSRCHFFICDTAGVYALAAIFRRPLAWVNFIPLEHVHGWGVNDLFIPKKLWLKEEWRFLTFSEILASGIGRFLKSEDYERNGIEVVENTAEEIRDLAVEMDERLAGNWQETDEDKELQQRFRKLFRPSELNQVFWTRIGAKFLRENIGLLN